MHLRAIHSLIVINSALIAFHLLVLVGIIPYSLVWGGKLSSTTEMYSYELPALGISLFFTWLLCMEAGRVKFKFPKRVRTLSLISFLLLFVLNTLGNALASTAFEKSLAFVTALMVVLLFSVVRMR